MSQPAQCSHCGKPLVVTIEVDDTAILDRLDRIEALLHTVIKKEKKIMDDQQHVDAEVEAIGAVVTDLAAAAANIEAEIAALKTANPAVDFTGLDVAVASLQGAQASVDALETPAEPAPGDGGDTTPEA